MKHKGVYHVSAYIPRILILSLLVIFASQLANGQENSDTDSAETIILTLEKKFEVSITVDAVAFTKNVQVKENLNDLSGEISTSTSIEKSLELIIRNTDLEYEKVRDDFYIIRKKSAEKKSTPQTILQVKDRSFSGIVVDADSDEVLPGVNIYVKGANRGTISDYEGLFDLSLPNEEVEIIVSYIGYKTEEFMLAVNQSEMSISLEQDRFGLDEVIVSGVASNTPRRNLSISVVKLGEDEIKEVPSSSASTALAGKVAGVTVVQGNGQPGSGASIRFRGSTSLTGNQSPMIIVDGTIISTSLADINVDDIESFEVVKGAAAAALYGSRAGNGVIVITTKRGNRLQKGKTSIVFRQEIGFQELAKKIETSTHHPYQLVADWEDYDYTRYEGVFYKEDGTKLSGARMVNSSGYADQLFHQVYDHQDLFFSRGAYNTSYLSILGNSNQTNFMISYERNNQQGIITETKGYSRNNLKFNLDHNISDKAKISTSNLFINTFSQDPGNSWSAFKDLLFISPDVDLTEPNSDGSPYKIKPDQWDEINENPLYPIFYRERTTEKMSFIGNVNFRYNLTPWMNFDTKYTYEFRDNYNKTLTPKGYLGGNKQTFGGSLYRSHYNSFNQNYQATININKQFNELTTKLKVSYLYENSTYRSDNTTGREFVVADVPHWNNVDPKKTSLYSYEGEIVAINYFGILDMDYMDKYIFSALYRIDGSSLFGSEERWHPYFRASAAYRLTEEFTIPGVSELKIRTSYGSSGQRPGFQYQYEAWSLNNGILSKNTKGNSALKASQTNEFEVGLDMEFLNRFYLEFVYSNSLTHDAIALAPLPSHAGYPYQWKNVGQIHSTNYELSLGISVIDTKNFSWNSKFLFDRIRQSLGEMDIPDYKTGPRNAFFIREGETFGVIYGYRWLTSLEEINEQLPDGMTLSDYEINSDGYVIPAGTEGTSDEIPIKLDIDQDGNADIVEIGDGNADFRLSVNNTLKYKGFSIYALLSFKYGGSIYNYTHQYMFRDLRAIEIDQFDKAEADKKTISYYSTFYNNTEINSYFIERADYFKIREVSISYEINRKQLARVFGDNKIESIKLGIQGRNLLTISPYSGYDPEVATGNDLSNYPFDDFGYPNFRTYSASLQVKF